MSIFNVLSLIGGLAMFLYGIKVMGEGLERLGGGKLEKILEKLTNSPIKGVCLGAFVTAIIQSSSATTVMVVGFVNSGIMKLSQAIGVTMGASIGTTITAWILSLTGIEGDSLFINLLKPINFSPIIAIIGIIMQMASKNEKKHNIANILLGFAVLMFGMNSMSSAVEPLADVPEFTRILVMFSNPVLGILAGAVLTAIIQSSSASVGILQALSATGSITFNTALPIILGQNIGACAPTLLSCIGANKNAKRAGIARLYFDIIGTTIFIVIFYLLNAFIKFSFTESTMNPFTIAVIHTFFNVATTIILLPFSKLLEKLAVITIKDDAKAVDNGPAQLLDERFLKTPSYAIDRCMTLTTDMLYIAQESFEIALKCVNNPSDKYIKIVDESESKTDQYEDVIGSYLIKLSSKDLTTKDSETISLLLHAIEDIEQISDYAQKMALISKEIKETGIVFSEKANTELDILRSAVTEIISLTTTAFVTTDKKIAEKVEPLEDLIDNIRADLKTRHINRLREGKCTVDTGFIFSDYIGSLERISDCCLNIAVSIMQLSTDSYDIHQYMTFEKGSSEKYKEYYNEYCKKYALPFSKSGLSAQ